MKTRPTHQKTGDPVHDRTDHVWLTLLGSRGVMGYKCCLCGAFTAKAPPPYPTPPTWMPDRFETLTTDEREMCPPTLAAE